jgi:malonate transporter and related proteins
VIDVLLNSLVPIFAIMGLGYFAGWIRDIDNHHVAEFNALVMDFALPASLFVATASTQRALLLAQ